MLKSSRINRIEAIHEALSNAHDEAISRCGSSLNRMPEFFMAMRVADHFTENFRNFGYRLEASVKRTFQEGDIREDDIEKLLHNPEIRSDGRFDLVLRTLKKGSTAHIFEFKRGGRRRELVKDFIRLAEVSRHAATVRLATNYIVFTQRCLLSQPHGKDTTDIEEQDEAFDSVKLENWLDSVKPEGVDFSIYYTDMFTPFLDREHEVHENYGFRVIIVEVMSNSVP